MCVAWPRICQRGRTAAGRPRSAVARRRATCVVRLADHVDNDNPLILRKGERRLQVEFDERDLSTFSGGLSEHSADLVTAAAFFDLVSKEWIARFCGELARLRLPLYAVLSYSGEENCRRRIRPIRRCWKPFTSIKPATRVWTSGRPQGDRAAGGFIKIAWLSGGDCPKSLEVDQRRRGFGPGASGWNCCRRKRNQLRSTLESRRLAQRAHPNNRLRNCHLDFSPDQYRSPTPI